MSITAIAEPFNDDVIHDAAAKQMTLHLNGPELKTEIDKEMGHLTETVQKIREANKKIRRDLDDFDKAGFKNQNGKHIELGPRWGEFSRVSLTRWNE